jgi:hypothetical protein
MVERAVTSGSWTTLAASQAAASPYIAPSALLSNSAVYNATSIALNTTASFSASGYASIEDANITWTGKNASGLTGLTWHTGYGTYLEDTEVYETNQVYSDTNVSPSTAVLYRITHTNSASLVSGPGYFWYYYPPAPATKDHCVVIFHLFSDLGYEPLLGASITAQFATNDQYFDDLAGQLHMRSSASRIASTNAHGLAFMQCYKNVGRAAIDSGSDSAYTFTITACGQASTYTVATIPDQQWVFFKDIIS